MVIAFIYYVELLAALFTAIILGVNNLSVLASQLISSRLIRRNEFFFIVLLGFLAGSLLSANVYNTVSNISASGITMTSTTIAVVAVIALLGAFTALGLPASITQMLIGGWLGSLAALSSIVNYSVVSLLVVVWVLSPIGAALLSLIIYPILATFISAKFPLLALVKTSRIASLLALATASIALGATGLGVVCAILELRGILTAAFLGATTGLATGIIGFRPAVKQGYSLVILGPIASVSSMLVASVVVLGLASVGFPASLTHVVVGAVIGAGFAHKTRVFNRARLYLMISSWALSFLTSMLAGYILVKILL